jgi:hypothetical protein
MSFPNSPSFSHGLDWWLHVQSWTALHMSEVSSFGLVSAYTKTPQLRTLTQSPALLRERDPLRLRASRCTTLCSRPQHHYRRATNCIRICSPAWRE